MRLRPGGDVGHHPRRLFSYVSFRMPEQRRQFRQASAIDDGLRLNVGTRYDVAESSKAGKKRGQILLTKNLHQLWNDSLIHHRLNFIIRPIGDVTESPTNVGENFRIPMIEKAREGRETFADVTKVGWGIFIPT